MTREKASALTGFVFLGTVTKYLAVAMGSAQEGAESMLHEQYNQSMSMEGESRLSRCTFYILSRNV